MKKQVLLSIVVFGVLCFALNTVSVAQTTCTPVFTTPGSFDSCFGYDGTGKVITTVPNVTETLYSRKARLQSDGKILSLMAAPFEPQENGFNNIIIRYNANGTLDTTFASGGVLYMEWRINGSYGNAYDMAVQLVDSFDANGNPIVEERIVVVGSAPALVSGGQIRLRVERYLPSGLPDTTFGTDGTGRVILDVAYALAVAIQPLDQKILTMGDSSVLVRLNANGTPDATFGVNGVSQAKSGVRTQALAVQSNGKILAAGDYNSDFAIARFNTNGTLDTSFGKSGRVVTDFARKTDRANDIRVLAGDYIIAAGSAGTNSYRNTGIARYTPNGQLDTSFAGGAGKATISVSPANDAAYSIDLQSNGKIVLFGEADGANGYRDFGLARFNANGTIDTTFGQGGKVTWDYLGANDDARGLVQRNVCGTGCDRIVAVGPVRTDASSGYGQSLGAAIGLIP
jgi:uncharacterized delta-60 repeat protein